MTITRAVLPAFVTTESMLPRVYAYGAALFNQIPIGVGITGPLVADANHTLLTGDASQTGRAATNHSAQALARGHELAVIALTDQPSATEVLCPFIAARATDMDAAAVALRHVSAELTRRTRLLQEHAAFSFDRLPNTVRMSWEPVSPITVIVEDPAPLLAEPELAALFDTIVARGRHLGIHLLVTATALRPAAAQHLTRFNSRITLMDTVDEELLELTARFDGIPKSPQELTGPGLAVADIAGIPSLYRQAVPDDADNLLGRLREIGVPDADSWFSA
ncbi:hypothetical protein ACRAWC_01755 [Leifsonia sp. L25]|uniref:hypothetical protein n=1 Tax=Actinomycetes TaxID=1760 RepID=UPI003D6956FC